jgi:hypothetical protein
VPGPLAPPPGPPYPPAPARSRRSPATGGARRGAARDTVARGAWRLLQSAGPGRRRGTRFRRSAAARSRAPARGPPGPAAPRRPAPPAYRLRGQRLPRGGGGGGGGVHVGRPGGGAPPLRGDARGRGEGRIAPRLLPWIPFRPRPGTKGLRGLVAPTLSQVREPQLPTAVSSNPGPDPSLSVPFPPGGRGPRRCSSMPPPQSDLGSPPLTSPHTPGLAGWDRSGQRVTIKGARVHKQVPMCMLGPEVTHASLVLNPRAVLSLLCTSVFTSIRSTC